MRFISAPSCGYDYGGGWCSPGASLLTLNDDAMDRVLSRESEVRSWYLGISLLEGYWGDERAYDHIAPIANVYALREALRLIAAEGIEER